MKKTFKKEERLCSKSLIDKLFHRGSSFVVYPFRVVYLSESAEEGSAPAVQTIISVSKRRFKRAHDRNRIKRLMREVYRLQKNELLIPRVIADQHVVYLAIQYVAKEELKFELLFEKMNKLLKQLANEVAK